MTSGKGAASGVNTVTVHKDVAKHNREASPRWSVCIPAYNSAGFIADAITSVLSQTFEDYELLVIDDGSTDDTLSVAARFSSDPRVRILSSERNSGMVANWNRAVRESRGEVIWLLHHDDLLMPDALASADSLHRRLGPGIVVGRHTHGKLTLNEPIQECIYPAGGPAFEAVIAFPFACSGVSVHRRVYEALGGFDPAFRFSADEEFWPRVAMHYPAATTTAIVALRRLHDANYMLQTWRRDDFLPEYRRLYAGLSRHALLLSINPVVRENLRVWPAMQVLRSVVPHLIRSGEVKLARSYLALDLPMLPLWRLARVGLLAVAYLPGNLPRKGLETARSLVKIWRHVRKSNPR